MSKLLIPLLKMFDERKLCLLLTFLKNGEHENCLII